MSGGFYFTPRHPGNGRENHGEPTAKSLRYIGSLDFLHNTTKYRLGGQYGLAHCFVFLFVCHTFARHMEKVMERADVLAITVDTLFVRASL